MRIALYLLTVAAFGWTTGSSDVSGQAMPAAANGCADGMDRFADCMNGTVTDTATGIIWLQNADCLPAAATYPEAHAAAAALEDGDCDLTDGSAPGDWRLPTRAEWEATVAPASSPGCGVAAVLGLRRFATEAERARCFQQLEERGGVGYPAVMSIVYVSDGGGADGVATLPFIGKGDANFIGAFGTDLTLRVWPVRKAAAASSLR